MKQLSIYTHIFRHNNHYYLYNSEKRIMAEITEVLYSQLYDRDFAAIAQNTLDILLKKGILVEDTDKYAFYDEIKMRYLSSAYDKENISLVIVPYTGCNFACPYCFEEKKHPQMMTEEVEDELIDFLNGHHSAKDIELTWYGGEPLLAFKRIQSIYKKLTNNTKFKIKTHSIVTNGFLINQEMLDFFKESKLNDMQITLDGTREHHNQTRSLKQSKQGTFDTIIDNIKKVINNLPDCHLYIRVNVNKNNEDDFFEIYNSFCKEFSSNNLSVYPGFIREETKDGCSLCYKSIDTDYIIPFYEKIKAMGGRVNFFPPKASKGCMISKLNSYIVGPIGEIYKCWNDVSNPDKIVGYINKKEIANKSLLYRYMNAVTPFSGDQCKDCLLFPVCSGGCGWYKYKNTFENGNFKVCSQFKDRHNLEKSLIYTLEKNNSTLKMLQV